MTEILFYITEQAGAEAQASLAWRIAEKAWRQGHSVYIHCCDEAHAEALDQLFWQQPATGFLPHGLTPLEPVQLGHGDDPGERHDVLINLAPTVPDFATRFTRVAEMITGDPELRDAGRQRFRFYRDRGLSIRTHNL